MWYKRKLEFSATGDELERIRAYASRVNLAVPIGRVDDVFYSDLKEGVCRTSQHLVSEMGEGGERSYGLRFELVNEPVDRKVPATCIMTLFTPEKKTFDELSVRVIDALKNNLNPVDFNSVREKK